MVRGLLGGSVGKEPTCSAGDPGLIPGSGRFPGGGNGNPVWYSCLGNPMNRWAWQAKSTGSQRVGHDLVSKPPKWLGLSTFIAEVTGSIPGQETKIPQAMGCDQ